MATPRMLLVFAIATIATVGVIAALATETWWLLPVALLGHAVGFVLAMRPVGTAVQQYDKPDPVEEARLQDEEGHSGEQREDTRGQMAI